MFLTSVLFSVQIGLCLAAESKATLKADFSGIEFKNGLLRVSVANAKLQKVMDAVAKKVGIRVMITDRIDEDLTVHFDYLPLERGLQRLLKGRNYVFSYTSDKADRPVALSEVLVFSRLQDLSPTGAERKAEKELGKGAKGSGEVVEHLEEETVNKLLEAISPHEKELRTKILEALGKIEYAEIPRGIPQYLEELGDLTHGAENLKKEIWNRLKVQEDAKHGIRLDRKEIFER